MRRRLNAAASADVILETSAPSTMMDPSVGGVSPAMRCRIVLFPEPLGPMSAQNAPRGHRKETSLTALTLVWPLPKTLVTFRNSIISPGRNAVDLRSQRRSAPLRPAQRAQHPLAG